MFKFYSDCTFESGVSFNWIGLLAVIVSGMSIFFTFSFVYLGKKIELRTNQFQKFGISNLDNIFIELDKTLDNSNTYSNGANFQNVVTSCTSDLQIFCLSLKNIYADVDINRIIFLCEEFSDKIYKNGEQGVLDAKNYKLDIISFKLNIYSTLYDYALNKELSIKNHFIRMFYNKKQN